ncbi:MAG: 5-formyltetrahydrofolate cyclo-ligase [Paraclostridium sp.]
MIFIKKNLRKKVISLRNNQDAYFICNESERITNILLGMDIFSTSHTIMTYLDFNNEVKTDYMINKLINMNKKVLVPITLKNEKKLLPSQIKDLSKEIEIGTFGIREPRDEFVRITNPKDIDILIVPAIAFDINLYRLGYGGGFYDRFIECLREDALIIGIAFDFQIFKNVPIEPHDAQMDLVVTESRILKR